MPWLGNGEHQVIINIRGTSGSGKSTLVRNICDLYDGKIAYRVEGRKQPIGYVYHKAGHKSLAVVGHYETDCGGCDTISGMDRIYDLVRQSADAGHDVIFEGLLISAEVNRTAQLHHDGYDLAVIHLDLPIEMCLDSVNSRREAKAERTGKPKPGPVNPKNTESKHKGSRQSVKRLREQGVNCHVGERTSGYAMARKLLGI